MKEIFKYYIEAENIIFKYASGASEKTGKEFHPFNEIILFLKGDAELITENIHTKIQPNTLIFIPKETYHQLKINGDPENYLRCTISFFDTLEIKPLTDSLNDIKLLECDLDFSYIFEKLIKYAKNPNSVSKQSLKAFLTLIICETTLKKDTFIKEISQNAIVTSAISYINENLSNDISISEIAKFVNISNSSLSHLFKKEMNISIHQYIIKKRLIVAHNKINSGVYSTTAAVECGFNDYSGFYKQYKKIFGYPPSRKTKTSD